jgi:glucan phosphoethanolaminetransferase (alkaline phosphatase superfamily)
LSYIFSAGLLLAVFIACVYNIKVVRTEKDLSEISSNNEKVAAFFETLRTSDKAALVYQSVFVLRRFILCLILVFLKASKCAQVFAMIYCSLFYVGYLMAVRPFETPGLNKLEIFNEGIILGCQYHMLMFTDALTDD